MKNTRLVRLSNESVEAYLDFRKHYIEEYGEEPACGVLFLNGAFYIKE